MNLTLGPEVILAALLLGGGGFAAGWLGRGSARRPGTVAPSPPAAGEIAPGAFPAGAGSAPATAAPAALTAPPAPATDTPPVETARPIDVGALVAGLAHEVRNPLFGISATLDAFEARFGEVPEHQPYTNVLRGELARITRLIEKLLEYGRPTPPAFEDGSLDAALATALDLAEPVVRARNVTLRRTDRGADAPHRP